ncbi:MAG: ATP-binding protein [Paludibacteraceae bacterium]|nr:ATP-binding protein [Paludibacteraceae bacterium]
MEIITREYYANKVDSWLGKEVIIVLTGQRRVGKSYILKDFVRRHQQDENTNIIYIDKEKRQFGFITNQEHLGNYIDEHFVKGKHNYILVDEIQEVDGWEHVIRSFRTEEETDVIITGSNSKMLSGELSTLLAGRYEEIRVQGLSYLEFLRFHGLNDNEDSLLTYLNYGGLPGLRLIGLGEEEHVWEYLHSVFDTVMMKDVVERHNIRNITFMKRFITFLADTVGKINSATSISKYMKSQQQPISTNVILDYAEYYAEAYLIDMVNRYDIHGRRIFESNRKTFFGDVGLRNMIVGGTREGDIEKVIENVVYLHLLRLGYHVFIGQLQVGEIDFVCTKPLGQRIYVQASYLITNDETRECEFGNLRKINDNYPKFVISMTPLVSRNDDNGIIHLHLRRFLTEGLGV